MKNRIWLFFFACTTFFYTMKVLVAETAQDKQVVGNIVLMFGTLTIVFAVLDSMGRGRGKK